MKFYSMFSGIGGFDLGLERAGHECVGACESNDTAAGIYSRHWPHVEVDGNARTVDPGCLPRVDLLTAGFPCQPFSSAGTKGGVSSIDGSLFAEALRVAGAREVPYVLFENVVGLLHNDRGRSFWEILSAMDERGYDAEWQCINGNCFLPQNRNRVFIVGRLRGSPTRQVLPITKGEEGDEGARGPPRGKGKRLRHNDHAGTLVASYWKRRSPMIEESGDRVRMLTPLEYERLQGFPEGFTEKMADGRTVSNTSRYVCLGNAVMVPVAEFLGERLAEAAA